MLLYVSPSQFDTMRRSSSVDESRSVSLSSPRLASSSPSSLYARPRQRCASRVGMELTARRPALAARTQSPALRKLQQASSSDAGTSPARATPLPSTHEIEARKLTQRLFTAEPRPPFTPNCAEDPCTFLGPNDSCQVRDPKYASGANNHLLVAIAQAF